MIGFSAVRCGWQAALVLVGVLCSGAFAANPVLEWNEAFIGCVRKEMPAPCLAARNLALLHLAMEFSFAEARAAKWSEESAEAMAGAAADDICRRLFPTHLKEFDRVAGLAGAKAAGEQADARAAGRRIAAEVLAWRANDGTATAISYVPRTEPGQWRRTPPRFRPPELPHWGKVVPFVLQAAAEFRPPPPPALNSPEYAREVEQVRRLGGATSAERTAEQTEIARFWSDFSYTSTPPGHWNNIARELAQKKKLPAAESARLFALLNVAMSDAGIAAWECKYHYNFWRPITAVQRAEEGGKPPIVRDPNWTSLLPSPPHPEYVSGHGAFSGAAAQILAEVFGTDALEFAAVSDDLPGVVRQYRSLQACAREIAQSRVYGGIHYEVSGRAGLELGGKVAKKSVEEFARLRTGFLASTHGEAASASAAATPNISSGTAPATQP